jgi:hypothetical protein
MAQHSQCEHIWASLQVRKRRTRIYLRPWTNEWSRTQCPTPWHKTNFDHITARMTAYDFGRFKIFTVSLSNGQIWRQLSGDITYAHWDKLPASYMVTISRGAFGSFNLQVKGLPSVFKVARLK